jgi:hypothetical protein
VMMRSGSQLPRLSSSAMMASWRFGRGLHNRNLIDSAGHFCVLGVVVAAMRAMEWPGVPSILGQRLVSAVIWAVGFGAGLDGAVVVA